MHTRSISYIWLLLLIITVAGCSGKKPPMREGTPSIQQGEIKDLRYFPQDVSVYARSFGAEKMLLSEQQQRDCDAQFNTIFFDPWFRTQPSLTPRNFRRLFGKARGYTGVMPWTKQMWDALIYNAQIKQYPAILAPAVTIRHTNLREMPTMEPRYSKPTPNPALDPFDYFQYSLVPQGTPLFISHVSRDKEWYFVENPVASGWILARDTAMVSPEFITAYHNGKYVAITKDNTPLTDTSGGHLGKAHVGSIFPLAGTIGKQLCIMLPVRGDSGMATTLTAVLPEGAAAIKPLPLKPARVAAIANEMLGQPYGWGGTNGDRDCSAATRDLFAPFGIWLPRNSAAQARTGKLTSVDEMPADYKESRVAAYGAPFMTLIWFKGHIGLYLGQYKGKAALFHNMWGIRVNEGPGEDNRHVIGRCVITSLSPGKELQNADANQSLINRMRGYSILPGDL